MTIEVRLDDAAARRLLASIVAVATHDQPLTPARAGRVQALATQLGLDFQALAAATRRPRVAEPGSRSEAEATYLAAAVLLAEGAPSDGEQAALRSLGGELDLGVAVRELDRLAAEEAPLAGLKPKAAGSDLARAAPAAPRAPAPKRSLEDSERARRKKASAKQGLEDSERTRRKKAGAKQGLEDSERTRRRKAGAKKGLDDSEGTRRKRGKGEAGSDERRLASSKRGRGRGRARAGAEDSGSGTGRAAAGPLAGLPPWALPAGAIGGALLLILIVAVAILGGGDPEPPPGGDPALAATGDLRADYNRAVEGWNAAMQTHPAGIPLETLVGLKAAFESVAERAEGSADYEEKQLANTVRALLEQDFRQEWEQALIDTRSRAEDTVQIAIQDGRYGHGLAALEQLPAAFVTHESGWVKRARVRLERLAAFAARVEGFLARAREVTLAELREAHDLYLEADEAGAEATAEYSELMAWFREQRDGSDSVFARCLEDIRDGDMPSAEKHLEIVQLIETDFNAYLARKTEEELAILAEHLLTPEERAALAAGGGLDPDGPPPAGVALGSGFFVAEGYVLTNAHVVEGVTDVKVEFGGRSEPGVVVARGDDTLDLALIRISGRSPTPLAFYEPSITLRGGVWAYGYGDLGGRNETLVVTDGTINAIDSGYIVHGASTNPGNSGGPLVDRGGRWIGVVVGAFGADPAAGVSSRFVAIHGAIVVAWIEAEVGVAVRRATRPGPGHEAIDWDTAVVRVLAGG